MGNVGADAIDALVNELEVAQRRWSHFAASLPKR